MTTTELRTAQPDAPSSAPSRRPSQTPREEKLFAGVSHGVLVLWSLIVVLPLLWTLMTSFKTTGQIFASPFSLPTQLNFVNYVNAWTTAGIGSALKKENRKNTVNGSAKAT